MSNANPPDFDIDKDVKSLFSMLDARIAEEKSYFKK
jgi:hypothetical protein